MPFPLRLLCTSLEVPSHTGSASAAAFHRASHPLPLQWDHAECGTPLPAPGCPTVWWCSHPGAPSSASLPISPLCQAGEVVSPLPRSQGDLLPRATPPAFPWGWHWGEQQHQEWEKVPVFAACSAESDPTSCGWHEGTGESFYLHWSGGEEKPPGFLCQMKYQGHWAIKKSYISKELETLTN